MKYFVQKKNNQTNNNSTLCFVFFTSTLCFVFFTSMCLFKCFCVFRQGLFRKVFWNIQLNLKQNKFKYSGLEFCMDFSYANLIAAYLLQLNKKRLMIPIWIFYIFIYAFLVQKKTCRRLKCWYESEIDLL